MNNKELVFCMLNFLRRNKNLNCKDLQSAFMNAYCMTAKDASDMICKLSSLMLFSETFNIDISKVLLNN